jgi:hypothetical protein
LKFLHHAGAQSDHRQETLPGRGLSAEAQQRIVQRLKAADNKNL